MTIATTPLGGVLLISLAAAATAQPAPTTSPGPAAGSQAPVTVDEASDDEPIIVEGGKPRGSVIGDIPPQNVLDARDVRATGATSISELLDALAPQIGSARGRGGGRPVMLLNGQRVSGFLEIRDIPPEAIQRVEILPEEVALKYGYRADQKVVNIVIRERFRSTTARVAATSATGGGYGLGEGDLTRFLVRKSGRLTLNAHVEANDALTEAERNILIAPPAAGTVEQNSAARTLVGSRRDLRLSAIVNRQIGSVSATLNPQVEHQEGRSLIGLGNVLLVPLARRTRSDSAHLGATLNGTLSGWRWTVTGNGDLDHDITTTDPDGPGAVSRASSTIRSADLKGTANGRLFTLPAGDAGATLSAGGSTTHIDSRAIASSSLGRTLGVAGINLDLPLSRRGRDFAALGNLTLNANAEVQRLSDFGTLATLGAGANWSPADKLNLLASITREDGPPTINQLGDPVLATPGARLFDFVTGRTALVTVTSGGNPALESDRRRVVKLGGDWQLLEKPDLRLRAEYVRQTTDRPISGLSVTPALEQAFPGRLVRNSAGDLVSADLRPVNFDRSRHDTLRFGFDFSKPLKSARPSQSVIDQLRTQLGFPLRPPGRGEGPGGSARDTGARSGGLGGGLGGGRGGPGGFFGGGSRGRLTFSLTDTLTLVDRVTIAPGVPEIDYLHGDAAGQSGGTPRHQVEAQAGYFNNGVGARLSANWRSPTRVATLAGDTLRFSPFATVNLRLFANPGDVPALVVKHPWLRGSQLQLRVDNLFDSRPKVRDSSGQVPLNYQPGLLDPIGRTVTISLRKLFLPSFASIRRQFPQMRRPPGG